MVPWPTGDEAGPGAGRYAGAKGVGRWSLPDGVARDEPDHPSIAACLDAVHRTLAEGPADAMGADAPGRVRGCLIRDGPGAPLTECASEHRRPIHTQERHRDTPVGVSSSE